MQTIQNIKNIDLAREIEDKIVKDYATFATRMWRTDLSSLVGFHQSLMCITGKDPATRATRRVLLVAVSRLRDAFPRQDKNWSALMRHISRGDAEDEEDNEKVNNVDAQYHEWARAGQRYDSFIRKLENKSDILLLLPWEVPDSG